MASIDGRVQRGNQTRRMILQRTMEIASMEGLEALSLGRLASELSLSKSGVFALFGSKEELQLATIRAASKVYYSHVIEPSLLEPPGLPLAWGTCAAWIRYSAERVFPGGCFFQTVTAEFNSRPGVVREAIQHAQQEWRKFLRQTLQDAKECGQIVPDVDLDQIVFEIAGLLAAANSDSVLAGSRRPYDMARDAIRDRLLGVATDPRHLTAG